LKIFKKGINIMLIKKILVAAAVSAAIAACSNTKVVETQPEPAPMPVASAPVVEEIAPAPAEEPAPIASNHDSVYFGFDKYNIRDEYSGIVKANSDYLAATHSAKVQIQGNTDDIGSVEYNLALGQRRADAVKRALIAGGAHTKQVEATSNGKLQLKYANDNPVGRGQSRRADIFYKSGQPGGYSLDSNGLPMVDGSFYSGTVTEGVLEDDYQAGSRPARRGGRHHAATMQMPAEPAVEMAPAPETEAQAIANEAPAADTEAPVQTIENK
jgi:peptidoglycan-associated lipoprotein